MNSFADIRKLTITALFSDDVLFEQLVLKGGNAMSLIYHISPRVSLDLDSPWRPTLKTSKRSMPGWSMFLLIGSTALASSHLT
jgi:hypothetical protein